MKITVTTKLKDGKISSVVIFSWIISTNSKILDAILTKTDVECSSTKSRIVAECCNISLADRSLLSMDLSSAFFFSFSFVWRSSQVLFQLKKKLYINLINIKISCIAN